jgi:hypothetical protein
MDKAQGATKRDQAFKRNFAAKKNGAGLPRSKVSCPVVIRSSENASINCRYSRNHFSSGHGLELSTMITFGGGGSAAMASSGIYVQVERLFGGPMTRDGGSVKYQPSNCLTALTDLDSNTPDVKLTLKLLNHRHWTVCPL